MKNPPSSCCSLVLCSSSTRLPSQCKLQIKILHTDFLRIFSLISLNEVLTFARFPPCMNPCANNRSGYLDIGTLMNALSSHVFCRGPSIAPHFILFSQGCLFLPPPWVTPYFLALYIRLSSFLPNPQSTLIAQRQFWKLHKSWAAEALQGNIFKNIF